MATYASGVLVTSASPAIYANYEYESSRSGATMNFRVRVQMYCTNSGAWRNNRWAARMWINGTEVAYNFTVKAQTSGTIGTTVYTSAWSNWYSYTDTRLSGTTSASIQLADTGFSTNWTFGIDWGSYNMNLPIIGYTTPSTISASNFNIGASNTISIAKSQSSFTHTITWAFGSASGTLATKTADSSVTWTPTASTLYQQIPNAQSGTMTYYCTTYNGNDQVGSTQSTTCTAYVVNSMPTISAAIVDSNSTTVALTGDSSVLIKGYSNASVTLTRAAQNYATVSSYNVINNGVTRTNTSPTTYNTVTNNVFSLSITDSRNFTTNTSVSPSMINYFTITKNTDTFSLERQGTLSSETELSVEGAWFNDDFGATNNTLTVKYRYKLSADSWPSPASWTDISASVTSSLNNWSIEGLSLGEIANPDNEYNFEISINDALSSTLIQFTLTKSKPLLDIGETDVVINGDIYINDGSGNSAVITAAYFWIGTQAQYTALGTYKTNVYYFITGTTARLYKGTTLIWGS